MSELKTEIGTILRNNQIDNADIAIIQDKFKFQHSYLPDNTMQPEYSKYLIYSITKVFIAALIMRLSDQKMLDLDEPVMKWFPEKKVLEGITIKLLLNHRSGLPDYGPTQAYLKAIVEHPLQPWSFEEYVSHTLEKGLISPPGENFNYSNLGYSFLKQIIQKVTQIEFGQYLNEILIKPCGLKDTVVLNTAEDLTQIIPSLSYSVIPSGTPVDIRYYYHPGWVAHGLLTSTAGDIAEFLDILFKGKIISAPSLDSMLQINPVSFQSPHFRNPGYGLGLMTTDLPQGRIYGHTGGGPGFIAVGYHLKSDKPTTIAILTNNEMAFSLEKAMIEILRLVQN